MIVRIVVVVSVVALFCVSYVCDTGPDRHKCHTETGSILRRIWSNFNICLLDPGYALFQSVGRAWKWYFCWHVVNFLFCGEQISLTSETNDFIHPLMTCMFVFSTFFSYLLYCSSQEIFSFCLASNKQNEKSFFVCVWFFCDNIHIASKFHFTHHRIDTHCLQCKHHRGFFLGWASVETSSHMMRIIYMIEMYTFFWFVLSRLKIDFDYNHRIGRK